GWYQPCPSFALPPLAPTPRRHRFADIRVAGEYLFALLSDRFGRRRTLLAAAVICGLGTLRAGFVDDFSLLTLSLGHGARPLRARIPAPHRSPARLLAARLSQARLRSDRLPEPVPCAGGFSAQAVLSGV